MSAPLLSIVTPPPRTAASHASGLESFNTAAAGCSRAQTRLGDTDHGLVPADLLQSENTQAWPGVLEDNAMFELRFRSIRLAITYRSGAGRR